MVTERTSQAFWLRRVPLATALVLAYIAAMTAFNVWKPRVLVLHSFSETLRQVRDTDAGLKEPLKANRLPLSLRWYYMNADQAAIDVGGHAAVAGVRRVIDDFNPTVVIAIDDGANTLLANHPRLWQGRRLFFVGINRPPAAFGYTTATGATGIRDQPPLHPLAQLFSVIRPAGGLRIAVLGSDTALGQDLAQGIASHPWAPQRLVLNQRAVTWPQWQAAVRRANREADILLLTAIHGLRRSPGGPVVPTAEVVRWTEAQSRQALPIGLMVDYVPLGGGLGVIPSSRYVGTIAMQSVLRWLEPSLGRRVPAIHLADHFDIGLREDALRRRGLTLPIVYREAARLSGQLVTGGPMAPPAQH
jgi:hypothetical protein